MNIFSCLFTDTPTDWHTIFLTSLSNMGHRVTLPPEIGLDVSWRKRDRQEWFQSDRKELADRLFRCVKNTLSEQPIDLFFAYVFPFQMDGEVFERIERLGIPTVYFYCDNLNDDTAVDYSRHFSLAWVPEKEAVSAYVKGGIEHLYLPMAADPMLNRPIDLGERRDVVFIGGKSPYRRWLLGKLASTQVPLEIYGRGWKVSATPPSAEPPPRSPLPRLARSFAVRMGQSSTRLLRYGLRPRRAAKELNSLGEEYDGLLAEQHAKGSIDYSRMVELFSEAKVSLGINHYLPPNGRDVMNATYSKMRDIEAPMSGACYLTQYTPQLDELYPEAGTIFTYRSPDELSGWCRKLLADDGLRAATRLKAREYCLKHHTWAVRFEEVFKRLGLGQARPHQASA